jgi:ABC-type Fe3+ transport system permease subunit
MKKSATLLAAAILPLVAGMGIATDSNAQSPMSDQAYCLSLVKTLRQETLETVRGLPVGVETAVAIAQCDAGIPGPAIPVLEQQLRDRDITVPSRG